ncbi:hypothetical protein [Pantoea sp. KPR_PJ]|uniref:hypothetical protein n=1 Tax=Pantoea sp. KPR_PJ TaxID=2738375 RepID=UPI0035289A16
MCDISWSTFWSAASAIAPAAAAIIAVWAVFRWKKQDELKAKMAFKLSISDYKYLLLQSPGRLASEELRKEYKDNEIKRNNLLSGGNNVWIMTEDLLHANKTVVLYWTCILENHRLYLDGKLNAEGLIVFCDRILTLKFIF